MSAIASNESYMYYEEDPYYHYYEANKDFYPFRFDFRDLNYGTYELRPLYRKHGDTEWQEVQLLPWETIPTITIPGGITFAKEPYFNNGNSIYLDDMVLHYTLVNKYDYEATGSIFYYIQTAIRNYYLEGALVEDITIGANEEYEGEFDLRSLFWGEDEDTSEMCFEVMSAWCGKDPHVMYWLKDHKYGLLYEFKKEKGEI